MRRPIPLLLAAAFCLPAGPAGLAAEPPSVAAAVAKLRSDDDAERAWPLILAAGQKALPELKKLRTDPSDIVRVRAAVLLARLGEASALDDLAALLESESEYARREAAAALLAFVGAPLDVDPGAPAPERAEAVERWKAWWKTSRDQALRGAVAGKLYGKILTVDREAKLTAVSLTAGLGAKVGMTLNVHRGTEFVCQLRIVMVDAKASVAQLIELSARTPPQPGDTFFTSSK